MRDGWAVDETKNTNETPRRVTPKSRERQCTVYNVASSRRAASSALISKSGNGRTAQRARRSVENVHEGWAVAEHKEK